MDKNEMKCAREIFKRYSPCSICRFRLVQKHYNPPCFDCKHGVKDGTLFLWENFISDKDSDEILKQSSLASLPPQEGKGYCLCGWSDEYVRLMKEENRPKCKDCHKEIWWEEKNALPPSEGKEVCVAPIFDPKKKYTCGICGTMYNDECDCICKRSKTKKKEGQ